jgi:type II secretory pathway pseudopilin PulG
VLRRLREESGFGLIELLMAIVVLNIGVLALMAAFSAGTFSLSQSSATTNGGTVADKVMEVYRGLRNCGIYLQSPLPTAGSAYYNDTSAYPGSNWVTNSTTGSGYSPIPASSSSCIPTLASGSPSPTSATQTLTGPDGRSYTVYSYIVIVANGSKYVKEVTVEVFDPTSGHRLIRESSMFDPNVAP